MLRRISIRTIALGTGTPAVRFYRGVSTGAGLTSEYTIGEWEPRSRLGTVDGKGLRGDIGGQGDSG